MKRTTLLLIAVAMLLPVVSHAYMIQYFTGGLAPSASAGAGEFTGSMATFYAINDSHASWDFAEASTSLGLGATVISGNGSVTVLGAGDAATSGIIVPFTLGGPYEGPVPYEFSSTLSIDSGSIDYFHYVSAILGIFNTQTYLNTGLIYLNNILPPSSLISPQMLGQDEAFFIYANAIEVKDPNQIPSPAVNAAYNVSFVLNPSSQVPEPETLALLGLGLAILGLSRRNKQ